MNISPIETAKGKIEYSLHGQGKTIPIVHGGHVNCREIIKSSNPMTLITLKPDKGILIIKKNNY